MPTPSLATVPATPNYHTFEALGTTWQLTLYDIGEPQAAQALTRVQTRLADFDARYSRFRPDSWVSRMARYGGKYTLQSADRPLLDLYRELYDLTDGAVTPLIGNLMEDTGYDATYSLQAADQLRPVPAWQDVLAYDYPYLEVRQPATLDFGAAGKGYAVDMVCGVLDDAGISSYIVDAGGDIRQQAVPPADDRIGLENPDDSRLVLGIVTLGNRSLCGSAGNRRRWQSGGRELHHIMDPRQRRPVDGIKAVWTVADTAMLADGLATALFFVPAAQLHSRYDFEYAILYDAGLSSTAGALDHPLRFGQIERSAAFPGQLFTGT